MSVLDKLKLQVVEQIDNAVFVVKNQNDLQFYWIDHPVARALIARQGAHLISYHPAGHDEQLFVSPLESYQAQKAIRGGVPICWPWFGKAASPSHGYARIHDWDLEQVLSDQHQVQLTFSFADQQLVGDLQLSYSLTIGKQLALALTTTNSGAHEQSYSGALHSYFAANRESLSLEGLGERYIDSTNGSECTEQQFALVDETDRVYLAPTPTTLLDGKTIAHQGNDSVVVWNPGYQLAGNMADLGEASAAHFICVETAITQQPIVLGAGESHTLTQTVTPG
ncbi:D-hexose-6-phosphate mutarotase [Aliagarivorans marinus]|uniref:D-hexose-6-phosphate mutarotase n=1 Tax=Aliagarivorans marinus TaxID=561965 RepID=UPI00040B733A|nr:D-hexose-6-phosphate mutarotase [Aliagarivorans marinus]